MMEIFQRPIKIQMLKIQTVDLELFIVVSIQSLKLTFSKQVFTDDEDSLFDFQPFDKFGINKTFRQNAPNY